MMKKLNVILILIASSLLTHAKSKVVPVKSSPRNVSSAQNVENLVKNCRMEFLDEVNKKGSLNKWVEQAPTVDKGRTFRTATNTFGTWLETKITSKGQPTLYVVTNKSTAEINFSASCSQIVTEKPGLNFKSLNPDSLASWYDDEKLEKMMAGTTQGLIYIWSPEMVYSAKYYKYFRDVASKLDLKFIPLIDPRASITYVDKAIKEFGIPASNVKLNSVELYMRNVTNHYPTAVVFQRGKIHDLNIVGVMEPDELKSLVLDRLYEL